MSALRLSPKMDHMIRDVFLDFTLSREAMNCSPNTLEFYKFTAGMFVDWLVEKGVSGHDVLSARHVRCYLAELKNRGLKDGTIHGHARAIRTFVDFLEANGYISAPIKVDMPKVKQTRPPMVTS